MKRRFGREEGCRWCHRPIPKGRFTFCSAECVHAWKLRTDPGYLREQVFLRDRGVCAQCGVNTEAMRKDKRKLDYRGAPPIRRRTGDGAAICGMPTTSCRWRKAAANAI